MQFKLFTIFLQVKMQMAVFLCLIALTAVFHEHVPFSALYVLFAVIAAVISDWVFISLRGIKPFLLSAAVVTGLIIGLLFSPMLPWYGVILTSALAMAGKNFIRYKNRHIFNPAALGLFVTAFIFQQTVSWWGVSFQAFEIAPLALLLFLAVVSPGYVSMIHMKRYRITASFFVVYILLLAILHNVFSPGLFTATLLDSTTLFFALVMLPEPMTTPNKPMRQLMFGALVGLLAVVVGFIPLPFLPDPLIAALLVGNAIFFRFR